MSKHELTFLRWIVDLQKEELKKLREKLAQRNERDNLLKKIKELEQERDEMKRHLNMVKGRHKPLKLQGGGGSGGPNRSKWC